MTNKRGADEVCARETGGSTMLSRPRLGRARSGELLSNACKYGAAQSEIRIDGRDCEVEVSVTNRLPCVVAMDGAVSRRSREARRHVPAVELGGCVSMVCAATMRTSSSMSIGFVR